MEKEYNNKKMSMWMNHLEEQRSELEEIVLIVKEIEIRIINLIGLDCHHKWVELHQLDQIIIFLVELMLINL